MQKRAPPQGGALFYVLLRGTVSLGFLDNGSGLRGGAGDAVGGEDGALAVGEADGDTVAGVVDDHLRLLRGGDDVVVLVTGQAQVGVLPSTTAERISSSTPMTSFWPVRGRSASSADTRPFSARMRR